MTVRPGDYGAPRCGCYKHGVAGVADALGIEVWQLLNDPTRYLKADAPYGARRIRREEPSEAKVAGWHAALLADGPRLKLLGRERGLTLKTVADFKIGWDGGRKGYTLPIRNASGELVNVSCRAPKGRSLCLPSGERLKMRRLQGVGVKDGGLPLYPSPLPPTGGLLCEGEWDALIARQHGLPAFTGLIGKQWNGAWDEYAKGRTIAVAYDVGAEDAAAKTVERLRAAGAKRAWVVPIGLPNGGDDICDWFVTYRRTADELLRLIKTARSAG